MREMTRRKHARHVVQAAEKNAGLGQQIADHDGSAGLVAMLGAVLEETEAGEDVVPGDGLQDSRGAEHGAEGRGEAGGGDAEDDEVALAHGGVLHHGMSYCRPSRLMVPA